MQEHRREDRLPGRRLGRRRCRVTPGSPVQTTTVPKHVDPAAGCERCVSSVRDRAVGARSSRRVGPSTIEPPPRIDSRYAITLSAISAIVTIGSRARRMLSRSGIKRGERPDAGARLRHVLVGVVGGAHERAGGDVLEAERVRRALERRELVRMPVADDRQVLLARAAGTGRRSAPARGARAARRSVSTISSWVSPSPTISPDFVVTSSPPSSFALRSTRAERRNVEPRRATG